MSKRQRWFGIFLAQAVLVCGCAPLALYGQGNPTATWTGQGNDSSWANGKNWSWNGTDNGQCETTSGTGTPTAIPPATLTVGSPCYYANVVIGGGVTVNEDEQGSSYIVNFSLGATSTLNGSATGSGNVTIGVGAIVNGSASATSGALTNQGAIFGSVLGATVINQKGGIIQPSGQNPEVFASSQGTNEGLIEALNAGGGPFLTGTGTLSLTGPWNNAGGTIQIDNGAVLTCDATITNGDLIDYGSGVVAGAGNGLTIAGTVNSTSLTIDGPGGPTTVTVTGTLNIAGTLTVGQTGSATLKVNSGGALNVSGLTILGAESAASGQMLITGTKFPITTGGLTIGLAGSGYVQVSGATLNAGAVIVGSQSSGSGQLNVGVNGVVNYTALNAISGSTVYGGAISIVSSGNLVGLSSEQQPGGSQADRLPTERANIFKPRLMGTPLDTLSAGAQVYGIWKTQSGLSVKGGSLTVEQGGAMSVSSPGGSYQNTPSFYVTSNSTLDVLGSTSTLAAAGYSSIDASSTLSVRTGAKATLGNFQNAGTVTVDGSGSLMTVNTYTSMGGILSIQNQAKLSADQISLATVDTDATNKLTIQSGAAVSAQVVRVLSGNALIETGGALSINDESNGDSRTLHQQGMFASNSYDISVGPGAATLTLSDTGKLGAQSVAVYPGGLLQITNKDSVTVSGVVSLDEVMLGTSRQAGGTINVLQGALNIGTVSGSGRQGWVTVGPSGTLKGGVICPVTPSPENPCIPNMLVGPGIVNGSVANVGGTVSLDPTTLNITESFQQTSGTLDLEIQGTQPGQYDQVTAGGSIQISGGTVEFDFGSGFAPSSGDKFNLLSAPGGISVSGASMTTTGLASGFNYTTSTSSGQFDLTATDSGTATTSAPAPPPTPTLASSDSASGAMELAPGSLASGYGTGLAIGPPASASYVWPTTIGGTSVAIVDVTGLSTQAPLLYVSSTEVDYEIPDTVALGPATVTSTASDGTTKSGPINIVPYAPGLFAVNSAGLSASFADCVAANGTQTTILTSQVVNGALVAVPLNLSACQQTVLELWTTGLDEADASMVQATIGGTDATVLYAGPQGVYPGVDQVNVIIPQSLAGAGNVPIVVSAGGVTSNTVNVTIQ
jgi:uncharacterized protein (TIGR03437 family)